MKPIYLDYNASTPLDPEAADAMLPFLKCHFGNPSSKHWYGVQARKAVEIARTQVASLLNCLPEEIIFTSGGTESNNYAIKGTAFANRIKGNHIITSNIEHPAVTEVCRHLERAGFKITFVPVDEYGLVNVADIERSITSQTILISIMHANNEVGSIQPLTEISQLSQRKGIILHTDAAQSVGKISVDVEELGVDLLSVAGHKLYAPKGIGALYIKKGVRLEKLMHGADHERGLRPGTENVLEIVGLGKACEIALRDRDANYNHLITTRNLLFDLLKKGIPEIRLNGHPEKILPNTLNISFPNTKADQVLTRLESVAASAGAACHSGSVNISHVLRAMKVPIEYAMGSIRFSTGKMTSIEEIKFAAKKIISVINS